MGSTRTWTPVDVRIAAAATPGFPVVTRRRLREVGVDRHAIAARLEDGRLTRAWGDTFLIGSHDLDAHPVFERLHAAVATVEPNAALAGVTAIQMHSGWDRLEGAIVVITDRWHPDIPEHQVSYRRISDRSRLDAVVLIGNVPTQTPLEAWLHAGRDVTPLQAANALRSLCYRTRLTTEAVSTTLEARRRWPGAPVLRRALALIELGSAGTKSRSEDVIHPFVAARYGDPLVNVRGSAGIPDDEPDFVWPRRRWILEVDGRHHLDDPVVRATDRARDRELREDGWTVVRIPWWWVWHRRARALEAIEDGFNPR